MDTIDDPNTIPMPNTIPNVPGTMMPSWVPTPPMTHTRCDCHECTQARVRDVNHGSPRWVMT